MQETWVLSLDWEDPLEKEIATHSRILAWEISWTDEPDGPQSMGHKRVERDWVTKQQQPHISAIMWYFYFTSLSMTISTSTHVTANCITSFFLHPLYICITSSLSIHLLMDIYMAPMSWLLWIVLLWTSGCMHLFKLEFSPNDLVLIWPSAKTLFLNKVTLVSTEC